MESVNDIHLLAIESAIAGGSIALFNGVDFISGVAGESSVSRAEDLLPNIESLLDASGVDRHKLNRIAISVGPGSYTGLRIGIATVMGLSRGLGIDNVGIPIIEAIADHYSGDPSLIALPMGRSDICIADTAFASTRVVSLDELKREMEQRRDARLLAHTDLIPDLIELRPDVIDLGTNLAKYVGLAAFNRPPGNTLDPIYIQNPRFGNALPA